MEKEYTDGHFEPTLPRAEKSGEAFREQKFNGMCVPEVSDQLQAIFFQF